MEMATNDVDDDVKGDDVRQRRQERGGIKAALTTRIKKVRDLMLADKLEAVEKIYKEIRNAMNNLRIKNVELLDIVSDPEEVADAEKYNICEVQVSYEEVKAEIDEWLVRQMGPKDKIQSGDSASQTGRASECSGSSTSSKVKLRARKAALLARAKFLEQQQSLKMKQAELECEQEKLTLETEIQVVNAEEQVYEEHEAEISRRSQVGRSIHQDKQSIVQPPMHSMLNPSAVPWENRRHDAASNDGVPSRITHIDKEHSDEFQRYTEDTLLMQQKMIDTLQLPKGELLKYDGDPLRYWTFIRSFETNVAQSSVSSGTKLNRLMNYCTGKALSVIEPCCVMDPDDGYRETLYLLKSRFGSQHMIADAWIRKITNGPSLRPNDTEGFRKYSDDLRSAMLTLQAMGKINEIDNQIRMVKIVSRLPYAIYMQVRWRRKAVDFLSATGEYPSIDLLVDFVLRVADEITDPVFGVTSVSKVKDESFGFKQKGFEKSYSAHTSISPYFNVTTCPMCSGEHALFMCDKFKNMTPEKRRAFVTDKRLCFNCFSRYHLSRSCNKPSKCLVKGCVAKHSRLIYLPENPYIKKTQNSSTLFNDSAPVEAKSSACDVSPSKSVRVALPIVQVQVALQHGDKRVSVFALLDSGSTNTFCADALLDVLGAVGNEKTLRLTTLDRVNSEAKARMVSLTLRDVHGRTSLEIPYAFGTSNLSFSSHHQTECQDIDEWDHLSGLVFPKVDGVDVSLIIGQDVPVALVPIDVRKGRKDEPYAVKTALGWVLNGPLRIMQTGESIAHFTHVDQKLEDQVERFWKIDACYLQPDDSSLMSLDDKKTVKIWDESVRLVEGHYEMKIPFKSRPPNLQDNYSVAENRLQSLGRRLRKDDKLYSRYNAGIEELLAKGFAEKVNEETLNSGQGVWYIPHHAVFSEHKPDKLRIVFDCASKFCGSSLNDQVYQGPDFTNKLIGVILRFRVGQVGIMGDIEGMFHQVKVPVCDRNYLRFLWFSDDKTKPPDVYRMTVNLFGCVWSPSCANFALRRTAEDNSVLYPSEVVQTVRKNFYVNDCLKSLATELEAIDHIDRLCDLLQNGGFKLHKWISNSRTVLMSIPEERRSKSVKNVDICSGDLPAERALGVLWDTETDEFGFRITIRDKPQTRRGLLSLIGSVYDPLGFVSPFVLQAKKIFQNETRLRKGWDELLSQSNIDKWITWIAELQMLEQFKLPRCILYSEEDMQVCELHHFSDASNEGYGAVSYLRMVGSDGCGICSLVVSKSRLTPLKQMTIPRLELSAAVIAVKLDLMLRKELDIEISRSVFWTDSTIVLQYIRNESRRFHVFVANRISLIHESTSPDQWRYVDSDSNPADDVSRGLSAQEMLSSQRWKNGPQFLSQDEQAWPPMLQLNPQLSNDDKEVRKDTKSFSVVTNSLSGCLDNLFDRYSSWYELKKAVAWILRLKCILLNKVRGEKPKQSPNLSVSELKEAESAILKAVQRKFYAQEIEALKAGKSVSKKSGIYRLEPVLSVSGVLCVGGRLRSAHVSPESKQQMILPRDTHVTSLIVRSLHEVS